MKGSRLLYFSAIISVALATFFSIINPLILRFTIDSVIGDEAFRAPSFLEEVLIKLQEGDLIYNLAILALLIVAMTILRGIFLFLKGKWSAQAAESIALNVREHLYDHLQHLPYKYHVKSETGDLIQRCTSDVDNIRRFLAVQFVEMGRAIFMVAFVASIMFSLHIKMTLVAMSVVPIIFAFSYFYYKNVKQSFKEAEEAEGSMSTTLQENLTGVRVVRAFARQAYEVEKFDKKNKAYRDKQYHVLYLLAWFWSVTDFLSLFQIAVVLIVGTYWTVAGSMTLGTLVLFTFYEAMLLWPVRQMGRILSDMGKTLVSLGRIQEVLSESREQDKNYELKPKIAGKIKFDNIHFAYQDQTPVIKGISFEVEAGETVAITGPTGAGKSTLMHLLARLYDYQKGSITVDGHEITNINKKWLRENIGVVLQEPFLFAKSIKENIALSRNDIEESKIYKAANNAAIHDVISDFEQGYETQVGERGVSLSGGQKQRIAIARTLIRECPILVFDDSLSAVDTQTDAIIRKALRKEGAEVTTFIISHRINTLAEADKIIVLKEGQLVQSGIHQELIKQPGLYNKICRIQNSLEVEMEEQLQEEQEVRFNGAF